MKSFSALILALLITGCNTPATQPAEGNQTASDPGIGKPVAPPKDITKPDKSAEPEKAADPKSGAANGTKTDPGSPPKASTQWSKSDVEAVDFATKLDKTLFELKNTVGEFTMFFYENGNSGSDKGNIVVVDRNKFNLDYFSTKEFGKIQRLRANGQIRRDLTLSGWSDPKEMTPNWVGGEKAVLPQWEENFSRLMFRPLADRMAMWPNWVKELRAKGYSVRVEVSEQLVGGKMLPFYRLSAKHPDKAKTQYELRVDGIRRLPLTLKMTTGAKTWQWAAKYGFDQPIGPEWFQYDSKKK